MSTADMANSFGASFSHLKFYLMTALIIGSTSLLDLAVTKWI